MFLVFALLILSLGVGLFLSVYSAFFPFLQNISTITDYNVAYYSALSAVERGSLVLKYSAPGFQGSGGVLVTTARGPVADQDGFLASGAAQGNRWVVNSRTTSIPNSGKGDVDYLLADSDSLDYNALRYHSLETILLSLDSTEHSQQYYSGDQHTLSYFTGGSMAGIMRLPPKVSTIFAADADLCANNPACGIVGGVTDNIMVNRKLQGDNLGTPFAIIPTMDIFYYSGMRVNELYDNAIRASLFTDPVVINFVNFSPILNGANLSGHMVISANQGIRTIPFETLLGGVEYQDLEATFGLISLLRTLGGRVYPYIEYRLSFPQPVADRFFTLDGHGRNREYDVHIQVKKPTVEGEVGGDFTVIF